MLTTELAIVNPTRGVPVSAENYRSREEQLEKNLSICLQM